MSQESPAADRYHFDEAETRRRLDSGELYVDFGPGLGALEAQRTAGKVLAERFNATSVADPEARVSLLRQIFRSVGEDTWLEAPIYVAYQGHTSIGARTWFNTGTTIIDDASVTIGDGVLFGPHVTLATAGHPIHPAARVNPAQYSAPITIEDNVWLGASVTVLPGVTIGAGSVVAAGSVVTKNVPPMSVVAGVPARLIRTITDADRETAYRPPRDLEAGPAAPEAGPAGPEEGAAGADGGR